MPVFEYTITTGQRRRKGTISADSARNARDQLRHEGQTIESLKQLDLGSVKSSTNSKASSISIFSRRSSHSQVSWFVRELATLTGVGTTMVESLQIAIDQCKGNFRNILMDIRERVTQGESLASALRNHEIVFGNILCEMVRVGEQSGSLSEVLSQAANFRDRRDKLKNRVISAMLYPAIVLLLSLAVTIFLMTTIVPTLISSLIELKKELPFPTAILKTISDFLLNYGLVLGLMFAAFVASSVSFVKTTKGRMWWDNLQLKLPIVGTLVRKQNASRLCLVTATLLKSGVELVKALEIAEGSVSNMKIRQSVTKARERIASGMELGTALSDNHVIPPAIIQVFTLGQHTGQLEELLFRIADDYDSQVNSLADRLATVMEPILIVGLSLIVGFIMLATLLPILESGNALSE